MYISLRSISIWAIDIEITKLKCCEHEFLTIQQIVSYVFHQKSSAKE